MNVVKIASNADGNSLFKACENVDGVGERFGKKLLMVSKDNQIKGNEGNCHLILSTGDWSEIQIANSLNVAAVKNLLLNLIIN